VKMRRGQKEGKEREGKERVSLRKASKKQG
jgi:hypothetical protein